MAVRLYYNAAASRARASTEWHDNWISKNGLKVRHWTDKAISQFLGKSQKAGPIMAWTQKEVRRVENTQESVAGKTTRVAYSAWKITC